jgi:hypothetical protein
MSAPVAVLLVLLTSMPPLTDGQRTRLDTAYDGRDHREEAFSALLENARLYASGAPDPGDALVRMRPDLAAMVARPDDFRGDVCRVAGTIQQTAVVETPSGAAREWFLRDAAGVPLVVYVVGLGDEAAAGFPDGTAVEMFARFYKRIDAVARDGATRRYAAFVGAHPRRAAGAAEATSSVSGALALGAVLMIGLVVVVALLLALARRQRAPRPRRRLVDPDASEPPLDDDPSLPDDPAEALAVLRRRAEEE